MRKPTSQKPSITFDQPRSISQYTPDTKPQYIGQILYIKPNYIVSVPEFDTPKRNFTAARLENQKNLRVNFHKNKLSAKAISRIKTAINWLVVSAKDKKVYSKTSNKYFNFKVSLITLTLPNTHKVINDRDFKSKLLHPWLVYMKKYHKLNNYVWKLEFQENGKLHAHITCDAFIDKDIVRDAWNRILINNDYMSLFKETFKHENPNSTDVHAVWKVKNLAAYLAKYLSKNEQNTSEIKGRIWGCSQELSESNKLVIGLDRDEVGYEMRTLFAPEIEYKVIETQDTLTGKVYRQAELFFIKSNQWKEIIKGKIKNAYDQHRFNIRNNLSKEFYLNQLITQ
jgi:hypothetical protein